MEPGVQPLLQQNCDPKLLMQGKLEASAVNECDMLLTSARMTCIVAHSCTRARAHTQLDRVYPNNFGIQPRESTAHHCESAESNH